jgi:hypothetical protein
MQEAKIKAMNPYTTDRRDAIACRQDNTTSGTGITYRRVVITDTSIQDADFQDLFGIFSATLKPGMLFREFKAYFHSAKLEYIDVTFILVRGRIIGFCSAAFYSILIRQRRTRIGRAAVGILEEYRGHTLPKWKLYGKYIRYWLRRPLSRIILTAYVANPLIYSMICKYTGIVYPRPDLQSPANIVGIKNELLRSQHLQKKEESPFVVEIHFNVAMGEGELERIYNSKDPGVQYFLRINPKFRQQHGVVVIIPINGMNILLSSQRFAYFGILKVFGRINTYGQQVSITGKKKIKFT